MPRFMEVTVRANFSNIRARTQQQQLALRRLPRELEKVVKELTPIDSGNARRNTYLAQNTTGNAKIRSHYPYAVRLDTGWSKQAPRGFTQPALEWLRKRIRQIFGRK